MTIVRDVCDELKALAPLNLAEEWDNVGLLLGNEAEEVSRVLTCLTLTADVAEEAVALGAGLIVTHHPVLFKPVKQVTTATADGRLLLTLIRHSIAVYSPHTAWDNSSSGINQQLAERLNLTEIAPLRPKAVTDEAKIVTFVPETDLESVRKALWNAGAGVIGKYRNCSFHSRGTGTFYGTESTHPSVGQAGRLEQVEEIRLEVVCPFKQIDGVLRSLRAAHPYEEPAVDVFSVKNLADSEGAGRMGKLRNPMTLEQLNHLVGIQLRLPYVQFVGETTSIIERIGIACGAAGDFVRDAHRNGCQAFMTGEAQLHTCLEARDLNIAMILPGHYATERFSMDSLAERLRSGFPNVAVIASQRERDPVKLYLVST